MRTRLLWSGPHGCPRLLERYRVCVSIKSYFHVYFDISFHESVECGVIEGSKRHDKRDINRLK